MTFDGALLWASDHCTGEVLAIDPNTFEVLRTFPSPAYRPTGLAYDGEFLWVLDGPKRVAYRCSREGGEWDRKIEVEALRPRGLAFKDGHLWVGDDFKDKIHEVDPEDGTSLRILSAPSTGVSGLSYAFGVLFVADREDDRIYAMDPSTGWTLFWLPSPGPHPTGLAPIKEALLISDYEKDSFALMSMKLGSRPYILGPSRDLEVLFTVTLRNFGPDPLREAEIFIAIPEERPFQGLKGPILWSMEPTKVVTEEGGQKVALFRFRDVKSGEAARVEMRAKVSLRQIRYVFLPQEVADPGEVPKDLAKTFTRDGSKLMLEDKRIKAVAGEIASRSRNYYELVRNTYEYVIDHLTYDLSGGWNAAPHVLERGSGSCSEYSMLLMALLRANRVPVRFAGSLVVRGDNASWDDVFHRWVEVFFPGIGFVPLDANKGDGERPSQRAKGFGELEDRYFVTTQTVGGGPALGWTYNYRTAYKCSGRCKVDEDAVAEWSPLQE